MKYRNEDGYKSLAVAVLERAIRDHNRGDRWEKVKVRRFLRSSWCADLFCPLAGIDHRDLKKLLTFDA